MKINTSNDGISAAPEFEEVNNGDYMFTSFWEHCDSIYLFLEQNGNIIEYNFLTNERKEKAIRYTKESEVCIEAKIMQLFSIEQSVSGRTDLGSVQHESGAVRLEDYLSYILCRTNHESNNHEVFANKTANGKAGSHTYAYVKQMI